LEHDVVLLSAVESRRSVGGYADRRRSRAPLEAAEHLDAALVVVGGRKGVAAAGTTRGITVADKRGLALPLKAVLRMGPTRRGPTTKESAGNG
jgi:hypothetical protein